jgi:hypothetical protein
MLWTLKRRGAQTMEGLSSLTGIGWAQVFLSVDRLSRIGKVSLTPVRPCEYRISIAGCFSLVEGEEGARGSTAAYHAADEPMPMPSRR